MLMSTGKAAVSEVQSAKSDPTVRSFASEDALAHHHAQQQQAEELSSWGAPQDAKYRFCRFEACTWHSFGSRPQSTTPHAFEARQLLLKLSQDPAIVHVMRTREYRVGLLAELDPIDDRLAEKMEGGGKRLLGYNTNAGAEIHLRLRTPDLSGFEPYGAIVDTLLHELVHNQVGPHNELFWQLFCQLKADYLRALLRFSKQGKIFGGKSALQLAEASEQVQDVRTSVLLALARDRQVPVSPQQAAMLDAYLAMPEAEGAAADDTSAGPDGGVVLGGTSARAAPLTAAERRELLAAKASARVGGAPKLVDRAEPPPAPTSDEPAPMDVSDAHGGSSAPSEP